MKAILAEKLKHLLKEVSEKEKLKNLRLTKKTKKIKMIIAYLEASQGVMND